MDPRDDLEGRCIVVTGASSGIGRATALRAASRGASLLLCDLPTDALEQAAADAASHGASVTAFPCDLSRPESAGALVDVAARALPSLDGAVCAAGVNASSPILDTTLEEWSRVLAVNLTGTFLTLQALARRMADRRSGGALVVLSSGAATTGFPNNASYCASKGGLTALTKCFALDLADAGIRVNAIAPGCVDTPMIRGMAPAEALAGLAASQIPVRRIAEPAEIAAVACFLLSDASSYMTGQTVHVNGGMFMAS